MNLIKGNVTSGTPKVIDTPFGSLRGLEKDKIISFKGVPYSASRTGKDRFAKPSAPVTWEGVKDATQISTIAPQLPSRLDAVMGAYDVEQSEDCLNLDIWAPSHVNEKTPVLVFIHGGAFMTGGGALPCYDGQELAKNTGLVVVNITYRLGIWGFMPMPELGSMNLGLHDQIAALRWIQQGIHAFGGDPDRVTLAGQSAGAYSIAVMLGTNVGKGLFQQAILMSAPLGLALKTPQELVGVRTALLKELGYGANDYEKLLDVSPKELLDALVSMQKKAPVSTVGDVTPPFMPVIDNDLIPQDPLLSIKAGNAAWCKTIIGVTREEHHSFSVNNSALEALSEHDLETVFNKQYGENGQKRLNAIRAKCVPITPRNIISKMRSDEDFVQPSLEFADSQWHYRQAHSYMYQLDWQSPMPDLAAGHCLDLPFLFSNVDTWMQTNMLNGAEPQEVADLTTHFQGALTQFVWNGSPNGPDLAPWYAYQEQRAIQHFDKKIRCLGYINDTK